ncbi:type I secretion system permease/ATPase [Oricola cellulosilytica]|uniref:Type I secretion system permease/ATPase n=1 Tax=Oricola cellulosilytica TaxID=1429082 RepID=A0A4R0P3A4_9HYPH|nr:type I secretion system permease/ATPase [Oricola cellulosilytica]
MEAGELHESPVQTVEFRDAVQAIAGYFNRPSSLTVLFDGVPAPEERLQLEDVERVARRAGLAVVRMSGDALRPGRLELPAIFELSDGRFLPVVAEPHPGHLEIPTAGAIEGYEASFDDLRRLGIDRAFVFSVAYSNAAERAELGEAEEMERPHWLYATLAPFWRSYVAVAVAAFFINLMALASPIFIMNVYDRILPNKATSSLLVLAVGVGLAVLFDLLLKAARASIIDSTGRAVDVKLSYALFEKVMFTSLSAYPASTGEYANRIGQYEFVREFFTSNTIATFIDACFMFVFLFVIYLVAGWLFVIPLGAFFLAVGIGLVAQYRIGKRVSRAANEAAQRQSLLVETISTIETVKSLRAEVPLLRKWSELTKRSSKTGEEIKQLSSGATHSTQFVQQFVTILVVIAGAFEFAAGHITTGAIIATVMLSSRTVGSLSQTALTLARFRQASLSLRILNGIMQQAEDRPSTVGFVNRQVTTGDLAFRGVGFQYPRSDAWVLRDLNISIKSGERVGIIGRIGSGKTTVGRLLCGLYTAQEGRVLLDGIDLKQFHPAEVRSAVSFVGQSIDLFSGTLKENLLLGREDATDEEIVSAARRTGVDEMAAQHPRGYDLAVGERGSSLSGGQRQAVALTRLLLTRPKIVFLDEPSGAMDMASEKQLINTLRVALEPEVTLLISTHRYSLLELVDRLVVLDRGKIIADGPKAKVLEALSARAEGAQTKG